MINFASLIELELDFGEEDVEFADRKDLKDLVEKTGVLLLPGTLYDDQSNHFRIGFGRKNFPEAIALLEEFLAR